MPVLPAKDASDRTRRLRALAEFRGPPPTQGPNPSSDHTAAIENAVIALESECCGPPTPPTLPDNAYFVVTSPPTRSSIGFDLSGAFTIEWYQTLTGGAFPRPFSIGSYSDPSGITFGVSLEDGSLIVWFNSTVYPTFPQTFAYGDISNQQVHFAVVRDVSGIVTAFKNGTILGQFAYSNPVPVSNSDLTIRNESTASCIAQLYGDMPSFRWVSGTALYNDVFTPPTMPLADVGGTVLLINNFPTSGSAVYNGFTVTRYESTPFNECGGGGG